MKSLFIRLMLGASVLFAMPGVSFSEESPTSVAIDAAPVACAMNGVCVNDTIRVVSGRWTGRFGIVLNVDGPTQLLTVVDPADFVFYPYSVETIVVSHPAPPLPGCYWNLCLGDSVRIIAGPQAGWTGTVAELNPGLNFVGVQIGAGYLVRANPANVRKIQTGPQCYAGICVGFRVRVFRGPYTGHVGIVQSIQAATGTLNVRTGGGYFVYPSAFDVNRI